jgi:serine protease
MELLRTASILTSLLLLSLPLASCGGGGGDAGAREQSSRPATFSLEGTIQAAVGSAVDGDVNDPLALSQTNNDRSSAQNLPNPVMLGGYVNQPGAGPAGPSQQAGDPVDWYRVSLAAGQHISLYVASDGLLNDLDLGLYDLDGNLLDASVGKGPFESLTAGQSGDYYLVVEAFQGAANYVLTIGQQNPLPTAGARLSDHFVAGEIIVSLQNGSEDEDLEARTQSLGLSRRAGARGRSLLLSLAGQDRALSYQKLGIRETGNGIRCKDLLQQRRLDTLRVAKALNRHHAVRHAAPNYIRKPALIPNDPLYPQQWHYPLLNLPQAWDITSGAGTIVAVLDTGVLLAHPDLQGQLVAGYDFIRDPANAGDGDGIDPDPDDPGDGAVPGGSTFHGTHIAGTVAATTNNTTGVAGVAFSARIMPLRVSGRLGATDYDLEQALRFAAGLPNDSGTVPTRRADVVNISLGGPGYSAASEEVYKQARDAGVVIIAAAGNQASSTPFYPASYPGVISVSAVTIDKALAPYSSFGPFIDVAAPGGNTTGDINGDGKPDGVLSTAAAGRQPSPTYILYSGTSMAAAHLSGVVALMRATNPALTPQDIDNLLASGALTEDLGTPGRDDRFGNGLINAYRAVVAAANTPGGETVTPVPILAVNPPALNFGLQSSSLSLTVTNGGGGILKVNPPSEDSGGWLRLSPAVDADGLGSYEVRVDRGILPDGLFTATVTFISSANTVQIPVIVQLARGLDSGEVGPQYVLLVAPDSLNTVSQTLALRQADGSYGYRFDGIPPGSYQIFAGSDLNNDGFICDAGESCGAYRTLDQAATIELNSNLSGLDFTSSFAASPAPPATTPEQKRLLQTGSGKRLRNAQ